MPEFATEDPPNTLNNDWAGKRDDVAGEAGRRKKKISGVMEHSANVGQHIWKETPRFNDRCPSFWATQSFVLSQCRRMIFFLVSVPAPGQTWPLETLCL